MSADLTGGADNAWVRFRRAHLFDYNRAATRFWLGLVVAGATAIGIAAVEMARQPSAVWLDTLAGALIASLAATRTVPIPRTKHSMAAGDIVIYLLLALHGAAAATFVAAAEGVVAGTRTSKRLTSRCATPAAAAAAMLLCGHAYERIVATLAQLGAPVAAAQLAALGATALAYFVVNTKPLTLVVDLKRGVRTSLPAWFATYSWVGAMQLVSATVAAGLYFNALRFGTEVLAVAGALVAILIVLLHAHFRKQDNDTRVQETRIADAEREAEQHQRRFHSAFTHAAIGMAIVAGDGKILQANRALLALVGRPTERVVGAPFVALLHPDDADLLTRHVEPVLERHDESFSIELRCIGANEREIWVSLHCARFADGDAGGEADLGANLIANDGTAQRHGTDAGLIFQLHDITSRRHAEGQLHHIAYHDGLTDLANRNRFQERLRAAVEAGRLDPTARFAVLFLDLDRFKVVNDSMGHAAGDELLKQVAQRVRSCVRPRDLVARLGGDEFAILVDDLREEDQATALATRVREALALPVHVHGVDVVPRASIGITFSDMGYRLPDEVVRDADLAMYKAKAEGHGRFAVYDASLHAQAAKKMKLETELRRALGAGELTLAYQPLVELETNKVIGFEALARWLHPELGPISPGDFIALAEESGLIGGLTAWALEQAIAQLAAWDRRGPAWRGFGMHVNVSGKDLSNGKLAQRVHEILQRHGVSAQRLAVEITESTLMERLNVSLRCLEDLRALGVRLSIDDFGTGYSSLAYLTSLPINSLKIDRSFVIGMSSNPQNLEIVRAVLMLGHSLNKQVIAEGIETNEQLQRLKLLGVRLGQGYLLSKPLAAEQVPAFIDPVAAILPAPQRAVNAR